MQKSIYLSISWVCVLLILGSSLAAAGRPVPATNDKAAIEALEKKYNDGFNTKNVNSIMECYAPGDGTFIFDVVPPREYASWDAYKKDWEDIFAGYPGPVSNNISDQSITVVGSVAYGHNIQSAVFTRKDGTKLALVLRVTDVYRKINGKWLIVLEHFSVPVDPETGKADLLSKP